LIGLLLPCVQTFADDEFIKIPSGLSQALVLQSKGGYSARMGIVTTSAIPPRNLRVRVFEVQFKDGRSTATASEFIPDITEATETLGPALIVSVPATAPGVLPGNYAVTLHVTPIKEIAVAQKPAKAQSTANPADAGQHTAPAKEQTLVLALSKPAPTLSVGPTVYIERTERFSDPTDVVKGSLRLTEESRNANITGLTLTAEADQKAAARIVDGALELPSGRLNLAPGESGEYAVNVMGRFPPGTYAGKINIRSPDLASVTSVNYEVHSRRSAGWIFVLAIAGAGIGLLTRVYLKGKQQFADAGAAASLAMEKLNVTYDRIQDDTVRKQIDDARQQLKMAGESGNTADLVTQTKAALDLLPTLETTFKTQWDAFQTKLAPLTSLLAKRWMLPASVRPNFDKVMTMRGLIAADLARNDVSQAEAHFSATPAALLDMVLEAIKWRAGLGSYVSTLDGNMPALSDADAQKVHVFAAGVLAKVPVDLHPVAVDCAAADADLTQTHGAYAGMSDFKASFPDASTSFLTQARKSLSAAGQSAADEWNSVEAATRAIVENVTAEPEDFEPRISQLKERLETQRDSWRSLLVRIVKPEHLAEMESLLRTRSWENVVTAATKTLPVETQLDFTGGAAPKAASPEPVPPKELRAPDLSQTPAKDAVGLKDAIWRPILLTGNESERRTLRRDSKWAATCQTVIVAALFVAGVYALNADAWIGTPKEMLALFILAYGVDLTADGVMGALKK
jgi:hypothetical protein